ncbi:MAG: cytochrome c [Nannocystaceae bacterium]|nr:cytochrome c [Nannocystaceae bacterium]
MRRIAAIVMSLAAGCGSTTELSVFGESFAEVGIASSDMSDGWAIRFSEFVVAIGDVRVSGATDAALPGWSVFDIAADSAGLGHPLDALDADLHDGGAVHYRIARPDKVVGGNATDAQVRALRDAGVAIHVSGEAVRGMQRVTFDWDIPMDLAYDCDIDAVDGQTGARSVELTIHTDHLFADDLDLEPQLAFDALAAADEDGDEHVTPLELEAVPLAGLDAYLTSRQDIETLWSFVGNLATTMAHVDGEQSCTPRFVPDAYADSTAGVDAAGVDAAGVDALGAGAALFEEHCVSCHEAGGPTLATASPGYALFRITRGGAFFPYGSEMPAFDGLLSGAEIAQLSGYLKTLQTAP